MADVYVQDDNRLKINTVLDASKQEGKSDPLLLVAVQGDEYLSQPFQFTVTLWRDVALKQIQPEQLINTKTMFGIDIKEYRDSLVVGPQGAELKEVFKGQSYAYRCGVIDQFWYESVIDNRFFQYKATIIPRFAMLKYETCFRIWQDKKFTEILEDFEKKLFSPELKFDKKFLNDSDFPRMEYCSQFGESSFNFLSRLMLRFGVWYFIDHNPQDQTNTLVLGRLDSKLTFNDCKINDPKGTVTHINVAKMWLTDKHRSLFAITGFDHQYAVAVRRYRVGDFNTLQPQQPFTGVADLDATHDWVEPTDPGSGKSPTKPPSDSDAFRTEVFPQQAESNQQATENAKADLWPQEAISVVGTGTTANPAFCAGYQFHLTSDPPPNVASHDENSPDIVLNKKTDDKLNKGDIKVKNYVIQSNHIAAKEDAYLSHPGFFGGIGDFFTKFWHDLVGDNEVPDMIGNFTNQGMSNYLQNQLPLNFGQPPSGPPFQFFPFFFGGGVAALSSIIPVLVKELKDVGKDSSNFSNSFTAIPLDWTQAPRSLPVPRKDVIVPTVQGPHLATVIGKEGTKRVSDNDIYADALGRVRIRFPWQWTGEPTDPWKWGSDLTTCWVRVTQGWAGRRFGMQFIPRVGEEVIVDFIAGDPDRPIITGRVYNADDSKNNLPFLDETKVEKIADLPPTAKTNLPYTGLKTNSMPSYDGGGKPLPARYHLLRFDDTRDKEQYLIRSQRRLDITALQKRFESISSDRHLTVGGKKITPPPKEIGGDYIAKIFRHYHLHVGDPDPELWPKSGNRNTLLEQNENLQVKANSNQLVGGNWSVTVGAPGSAAAGLPPIAQATIDAPGPGGTIVLNSLFNITLTVGSSAIVLTPLAISITSPAINLVGPVLGPTPVMGPNPVQLPAELPIDAGPVTPTEPTPADPGDKLTPPKE